MMRQNGEDWVPSAGLLAAHADGELEGEGPTAVLRQRVEEWLLEHPVAARTVEAHRRLTQWCQATAPADPGEAAWGPLVNRLQALPRSLGGSRRRPRWTAITAFGTTAAACVWLALTLVSSGGRQQTGTRVGGGPEVRLQA